MFEWITEPSARVALATLTALEIVLGIAFSTARTPGTPGVLAVGSRDELKSP